MTNGKKKFGAFGGVFTPSILTILGVIMYLRLGWVVGNAGLWGTIGIILLAHVISITTGLSISSIATDKKVGAGGVYYVLSRSLGLPIGGAIGITLFIGTALSIALYIVGFSESFNAIIGLESSIDNIRLTGSIALLTLTIIAFISTSLAIKTQFFILAAIFISLASIFFGHSIDISNMGQNLADPGAASFETIFAIFFPAVTGFTAGIAMSGDLKDPKRAIPVGTIVAISVGFVVYMGLALFLYFKVDASILRTDYNILEKIAVFGPAVIAGIWGATLSSALGGILGGPRILQAMSLDKITPTIFGKEQGKTKEPRLALIVAIILAEAGILIGDLDIVARVVSMFYLAAYGFINISFFLESWASADFRPSFKVNRWFGFLGFLATFGVMFQLDMIAMILALIIIGGIYIWLTRREIALGTGDIWRSVWSTSVKEGLKRLEQKEDHKRNWKPNILLFSGNSEARPHLIEFSQALSGRAGLVTNFDLIENEGMDVLFTKHKQSVKDELLQKYGIFGRQIDVKNIYKGIETIAATFGFSGIDPNTVLMGWARNTKDPIWFAQMTQKLIDLDYNVLYMDYDQERGFGTREQIDLWWRGISNNAELMLQIAKFISFNPTWRKANIRILLVNDYNVDRRIIENRISNLLEEFRLKAEIKVIDNHLERKPFYHILKLHSLKSDLVLFGIPNIIEGAEKTFVQNTNDLVKVIGTTLLVKGSTTFDVTQLGLKDMVTQDIQPQGINYKLDELSVSGIETVDHQLLLLDQLLQKCADTLSESTFRVIAQHYIEFVDNLLLKINTFHSLSGASKGTTDPSNMDFIGEVVNYSNEFSQDTLPLLSEILGQGINTYHEERKNTLKKMNKLLEVNSTREGKSYIKKLHWSKVLTRVDEDHFPHAFTRALKEFGIISIGGVTRSKELIKTFIEMESGFSKEGLELKELEKKFVQLKEYLTKLIDNTLLDIRYSDRKILNILSKSAGSDDFNKLSRTELYREQGPKHQDRKEFIRDFGDFWLRNQLLFHDRFETGIELKRTNMILKMGTQKLMDRLEQKTLKPLLSTIENLKSDFGKEKKQDNLQSLTPPMYDYLPDYRRFTRDIGKAIENLPAEVEMMDTNSEINIQDKQGKGVSTVTFSVDKIAEYLIETRYKSLIHENLENFNREINTYIGELVLMITEWDHAEKTPDKELREFIKKNIDPSSLIKLSESAIQAFESSRAEVEERLNQTMSQLEVQPIIDQSEVLKQYIRKKEIRQGLNSSLREYRSMVNRQIKKGVRFFTIQNETRTLESYKEMLPDIMSVADRLRTFILDNESDQLTKNSIPYYYRQLFCGKHLHSQKTDSNRKAEINGIKRIVKKISEGSQHGAILITGQSLSGKSYLTEKVVNFHLKGKVHYIRPLQGGATHPTDLDKAFATTTGQNGLARQILMGMEERSIIVLSNLEMWWLNNPDGIKTINYLVDLIHHMENKHYFILNGNIHALNAIRKTTRINEIIAETIVLNPMNKEAIRNEILRRHKIGGLSLEYKGSLVTSDREDRQFDQLFSIIFNISKGNIGHALQLWLQNIVMREDGKFILNKPQLLSFPEINDPDWQNILTQFILHKSLSHEKFKLIYDTMPEKWLTLYLNELKTAQILENPESLGLSLNNFSLPYIESWLIENELI